MRCKTEVSFRLIITIIVLSVILTGCKNNENGAKLLKVTGEVETRSDSGSKFVKAVQNSTLPVGGAVRTRPESSADLLLPDNGGIVELKQDSYFEFTENSFKQNSGTGVYRINPSKKPISVETPHGITGVIGTVFEVTVSSSSTKVGVSEGKVRLTSKSGTERILESGKMMSLDLRGTFSEAETFDNTSNSQKFIKKDNQWVPAE
ncbi:MAG: FecR domain-containing protein [Candidatus Rifleibacteriota bacterium]